MPRAPYTTLAPGIYADDRGITAVVVVGSNNGTDKRRRPKERRFPLGTPVDVMQKWQAHTRRSLATTGAPLVRAMPGTLADDAAIYLATVTAMPSYEARRADLEAWLQPFGHRSRHSLTAVELNAQLNTWQAAGYAASTLNHRRQALRAVYQLLDPGSVPPVNGTTRATPPPLMARAIGWDDVREVVAALPDSKSGAMLRVLAFTGLPPARIARLTPRDVDWTSGTVFLIGRVKGAGTASKTIRVMHEALDALRDHFRYFPTGGSVSKNSWLVVFHRTVGRVNAERARTGRPPLSPDLRPYDLRHSFGTEVYRRRNDINAAAAMLDVSLETAQRYTLGAVDEQIEKAVDDFNRSTPARGPRLVPKARPQDPA
jgi:integrase